MRDKLLRQLNAVYRQGGKKVAGYDVRYCEEVMRSDELYYKTAKRIHVGSNWRYESLNDTFYLKKNEDEMYYVLTQYDKSGLYLNDMSFETADQAAEFGEMKMRTKGWSCNSFFIIKGKPERCRLVETKTLTLERKI